MNFKIKHNYDPKKVSEIFRQEITRSLNEIADTIAGATVGKSSVGIAATFTHDSTPDAFGANPSPVGGPPGVLTGTLRRSFRTRPVFKEGRNVRVAAGTNVAYARDHEFGLNGMPARPFMEQGIQDALPYATKLLNAAPRRILKRINATKGPPK